MAVGLVVGLVAEQLVCLIGARADYEYIESVDEKYPERVRMRIIRKFDRSKNNALTIKNLENCWFDHVQ